MYRLDVFIPTIDSPLSSKITEYLVQWKGLPDSV